MNEKQKSTYIAWLNDAHALEVGLVRTLEKQMNETKDLPAVSKKIKEHLEETKTHAKKVEDILARLESSHSAGKDILSQISSVVGGVAASLPADALVKNLHTSYAAEHMEIATYTMLTAAAEELGDTESIAVYKSILKDEEGMADWCLAQLTEQTQSHLEDQIEK